MTKIVLACVLLNYCDALSTIESALRLLKYRNIDYIIIVDNASREDDYCQLKKLSMNKNIVLHRNPINGGYGYGNNVGIDIAKKLGATHVIISNPDVTFSEDCVNKLVEAYSCYTECVAIAPTTYYKGNICASKLPNEWQLALESLSLYNKLFGRKTAYSKTEFDITPFFPEVVVGAMISYNLELLGDIRYDEEFFLYCEEIVIANKFSKNMMKTMLLKDAFYEHKLSTSIDKEFDSIYKKRKLASVSKKLYIRKYLHPNYVKRIICDTIIQLSVYEAWIIDLKNKCIRNQ